jgi:hypothetical protein
VSQDSHDDSKLGTFRFSKPFMGQRRNSKSKYLASEASMTNDFSSILQPGFNE